MKGEDTLQSISVDTIKEIIKEAQKDLLEEVRKDMLNVAMMNVDKYIDKKLKEL